MKPGDLLLYVFKHEYEGKLLATHGDKLAVGVDETAAGWLDKAIVYLVPEQHVLGVTGLAVKFTYVVVKQVEVQAVYSNAAAVFQNIGGKYPEAMLVSVADLLPLGAVVIETGVLAQGAAARKLLYGK